MLRRTVNKIAGMGRLGRAMRAIWPGKRKSKGRKVNVKGGGKDKRNQGRERVLSALPTMSVGAEIGVHRGDFSKQILSCVKPNRLHLIDPWEHQSSEVYSRAWYGGRAKDGQKEMDDRYLQVCHRFADECSSGQVIIHREYSTDVLKRFPDGYFDWVYIDGNHLYEYVKMDLEISLLKTKSGGWITGDDYTEGGWWEGGVKRAVDELTTRDEVELITITEKQFIFRRC